MDSFQEIFKKFLQYYFMWTIKFLKDSPVCFDGYFVRNSFASFYRMLEPPYPLQKSHFDEFLFSKILFKWSKFKSFRSRDRFFVEFVPLRKIVGAMVL